MLSDWHINLKIISIKMIGDAMLFKNYSKWKEVQYKKNRTKN